MKSPGRPPFTPLQGQYLAFIATYERIHDQAPAESDFEDYFRTTPPTVHQMILRLARKGWISRMPGVARSIRLHVPIDQLPQLPALKRHAMAGVARGTPTARPWRTHCKVPRRPAKVDRAEEYIDSPRMTYRLRYARHLSALIDGNYGSYRTEARLTPRADDACTCPSEARPCKHVRALRATWKVNPESFFDMRPFLQSLRGRDSHDLAAATERIIAVFPAALEILGVTGLGPDDTDS